MVASTGRWFYDAQNDIDFTLSAKEPETPIGIFTKLFGSKRPAPPCEIHPEDQDLVRPEDHAWWNSLSQDDCNAFGMEDKAFRFAAWQKYVETDGLSDFDAGKKVQLGFPGYYVRPVERDSEKFALEGHDALLPIVLKERINRALVNGAIDKRAIQNASSFNALVRQMIRAGRM